MSDGLIKIEEASRDEWEAAMEVAWRTFLKFEAPGYEKEGIDNFLEFISSEKLYTMFLIGEYHTIVAKDNDTIIGVASLRGGSHVSLLFVDEKYHRRGIGRELLINLQKNVDRLNQGTMTVNAAPYAIGFYERVGFIKVGDVQKTDGIIYQPMRSDGIIKK